MKTKEQKENLICNVARVLVNTDPNSTDRCVIDSEDRIILLQYSSNMKFHNGTSLIHHLRKFSNEINTENVINIFCKTPIDSEYINSVLYISHEDLDELRKVAEEYKKSLYE